MVGLMLPDLTTYGRYGLVSTTAIATSRLRISAALRSRERILIALLVVPVILLLSAVIVVRLLLQAGVPFLWWL